MGAPKRNVVSDPKYSEESLILRQPGPAMQHAIVNLDAAVTFNGFSAE